MGKETIATVWWILVIALVAVMSAVILYPKMQVKKSRFAEKERREAVLKQKIAERDLYQEKVDALKYDKDAVERTAKEKFNLVRKGETIIRFKK